MPSSNSGFLVVRTNKSFRPLWRNKKKNRETNQRQTPWQEEIRISFRNCVSHHRVDDILNVLNTATFFLNIGSCLIYFEVCQVSNVYLCREKSGISFKWIKETERHQRFYVPLTTVPARDMVLSKDEVTNCCLIQHWFQNCNEKECVTSTQYGNNSYHSLARLLILFTGRHLWGDIASTTWMRHGKN